MNLIHRRLKTYCHPNSSTLKSRSFKRNINKNSRAIRITERKKKTIFLKYGHNREIKYKRGLIIIINRE